VSGEGESVCRKCALCRSPRKMGPSIPLRRRDERAHSALLHIDRCGAVSAASE
jgi:hypothetical protein